MPGKPSAARPLCRGETKAGNPCKNRAAAGSQFCGSHGGNTKKLGAPSKLDEELIDNIVAVVERGVTWEVAAQSVGIHKSTLLGWRERGAEDLAAGKSATLYAYLVDRLTRATAEAEATLVETIRSQGKVDWRAAAFILERRAPERWARRDKLDVDVHERAQPREVKPDAPARDEILALLKRATAAPAGADS